MMKKEKMVYGLPVDDSDTQYIVVSDGIPDHGLRSRDIRFRVFHANEDGDADYSRQLGNSEAIEVKGSKISLENAHARKLITKALHEHSWHCTPTNKGTPGAPIFNVSWIPGEDIKRCPDHLLPKEAIKERRRRTLNPEKTMNEIVSGIVIAILALVFAYFYYVSQ